MKLCSNKCDLYNWCKSIKFDLCDYCTHKDDKITYNTCDKCNTKTCNFKKAD